MSPTGEARHLELGSYVTENGFGHEEWLFNLAWMVDAYHYSFLQPVNRSFNNLSGQTIHVLLYTVSPIRDRLYVGEIRNCEVLTSAQAADAVHHYRMQGWLDIMANQVKHVDGRFESISEAVPPTDIFNIRFRKADVQIYDPFSPAAKDDLVWKLNRYEHGRYFDSPMNRGEQLISLPVANFGIQ